MLPSLGALKGVGSGLYNMGRGALFLGASKGATGAGKTMNALGHAVPLAPAVAGSFKATSNQPGFQPQSTVKMGEDGSPSELVGEVVKEAVSKQWIKQRVQSAADVGTPPSKLQDFAEKQFARAKQTDPRLGYPKQHPLTAAEHHARKWFDAGHAAHIAAADKTLPTTAQSSTAGGAVSRLRRYGPFALGGAIAAGAYGLYRHNRNSPSEQEAEPKQAELHPLVERGLRAKLASDWHRPVNALAYSTVKTSVSREWINQRVQNAVNSGVDPYRMVAFSDRNNEAFDRLLGRLWNNENVAALVAAHPVLSGIVTGSLLTDSQINHIDSARGKRHTAFIGALSAGKGPGEHSYEVPRYGNHAPSSHTIAVPTRTDPTKTVSTQAVSSRTPKLLRNAALAAGAGLGAYGLYRALKKEEPTVKSSAELPPVVARALLAKVASGPGFDWHRPVNALSYAAFAAPYLSQTVHDNHKLTTALNAAGLLGLGATSADSLAKGDSLAGYDLAGLGLMGAGLVHGALRPTPTPGAGH
jgi:hypothetical protein